MVISTQKTLVGWKAIAGYLSRDERTVMRWAASRGMPIQRVAGRARSSVYAWPEELDAWLGGTRGIPEPVDPLPPAVAIPPVAAAPPAARDWRKWRRYVWAIILAGVAIAATAIVLWQQRAQDDPAFARESTVASAFHDPRARAAFLQAQFDWNLRTRESLLRAISEYGDAATRDPGVTASYVGIANTYLLLRQYAAMPDDEAYPRARAAAKLALTLDPRSMEARRTLAFISFWWDGDIATSAKQFAQALAIAPNDPLTHHWLANALTANGEQEAAFREIATARALDPTASSVLVDYGVIAYLSGHRDESARILHLLQSADPQNASLHQQVATIALFERRDQDYIAEAARAADLRHDPALQQAIAMQASDFSRGGATLLLERMIDTARDRTRRTDSGFYRLARVAAISGRTVAAIDALAPACTRREHDAIGAPGDLWLTAAVSADTIHRLCPRPSLIAALARARRV